MSLVTSDDDIEGAYEHKEFYTRLITVNFNKKLAYLNTLKTIFNDRPSIVEYFTVKQCKILLIN